MNACTGRARAAMAMRTHVRTEAVADHHPTNRWVSGARGHQCTIKCAKPAARTVPSPLWQTAVGLASLPTSGEAIWNRQTQFDRRSGTFWSDLQRQVRVGRGTRHFLAFVAHQARALLRTHLRSVQSSVRHRPPYAIANWQLSANRASLRSLGPTKVPLALGAGRREVPQIGVTR